MSYNPPSTASEQLKADAAAYAVRHYIRSGMTIGLGTGSTVYYFVQQLGALLADGALADIRCLSSSAATAQQAQQIGIPIWEYDALLSAAPLDITVDGADNINRKAQLVKGGGGALTREKIIAYNSRRIVIIADSSKYAPLFRAGTVIPVEVLQIATTAVRRALCALRYRGRALFDRVELRRVPPVSRAARHDAAQRRTRPAKAVYQTDNHNVILDARLCLSLRDARGWERELNAIAGVVENGLFTQRRAHVVLASPAGVTCQGAR